MLREEARNRFSLDQFPTLLSNSLESCKAMVTLESSKLSMTTDQERSLSNLLAESTSVPLSPPDSMLRLETSRDGQATSSHPDNSVTSSFQPVKESSPMMKPERDTLEARLWASSIDRFTLTPRCQKNQYLIPYYFHCNNSLLILFLRTYQLFCLFCFCSN